MKEFQERQKTKRRVYSKTTLVLMLVIFIFITKGVFSVYSKERESAGEIDRIQSEKNELDKRYLNIVDQNDSLKSETGVESEIRNKFDVAKEGEGVIVIVEKEIPIIEEDKRGVLKKFWDSVKDVFGAKEEVRGTTSVIMKAR